MLPFCLWVGFSFPAKGRCLLGADVSGDLAKLLLAARKNRASDIHIKSGQKPLLRINTIVHEIGSRALTSEETSRMFSEVMTEGQKDQLEKNRDVDFAASISDVGRFRFNLYYERGSVAAAIRRVETEIPSFEELHIPASVQKVCSLRQGLIVVAGPTSSGKSTTIASILNYINETQKKHIVTIEDPIEYLFEDKKSFISQREIGIDVPDYHQALKTVVRQDPDVILIGEMRDYLSFDAALSAAETGHLVFATIHASSSAQCIGRLLDLFPTERQSLIRQSLSFNLRSILCQRLLPSSQEDVKMVPAVEIFFNNSTAQKLIAAGDDKKLGDLLKASKEEGMQDLNMSLVDLVDRGLTSKKAALQHSPNPEQLKMNLQGIYLEEDHRILG